MLLCIIESDTQAKKGDYIVRRVNFFSAKSTTARRFYFRKVSEEEVDVVSPTWVGRIQSGSSHKSRPKLECIWNKRSASWLTGSVFSVET